MLYVALVEYAPYIPDEIESYEKNETYWFLDTFLLHSHRTRNTTQIIYPTQLYRNDSSNVYLSNLMCQLEGGRQAQTLRESEEEQTN